LIQTFKIIKGMKTMNKVDKGFFFEFDSSGRRGHSNMFKKRTRLDIRKYTFNIVIIELSINEFLYLNIVLIVLR